MYISFRAFNILAILIGLSAVIFLPFWPYSTWGYVPSIVLVTLGVFMFALRGLARD